MKKVFIDQMPDIRDVEFSIGRSSVEQRAKNYVIYCRRSEEDDDRKSIPAQQDQCISIAEREGLNVIGIIREQKSARAFGRIKFTNLLRAIKGEEELKYLEPLPGKRTKRAKPDGIIAWHPDRLSRNMRDAGEIIEMLDDGFLVDLQFAVYSFHNDSSGKEHLAMEFARAKGYSDHLQDNVFRGTMRAEKLGKQTKRLPPAFTKVDDESDPYYGKIIASKWHEHWRNAYRWKLSGKSNKEIASLLKKDGYKPMHKNNKKWKQTTVDKDHVSLHIRNPLHCGLLAPKESKEPRVADLNEIYPSEYSGEHFPVVVTLEDFKKVNPKLFSDTAKKPVIRNKGTYALSGKVLCKKRIDDNEQLITLAGQTSRDGSKKPSPRFACQRCKPSHSINMNDLYDAIGEELKSVKLTEKEHKLLVVTEWHHYRADRDEEDVNRRQLNALKGSNTRAIQEAQEILNRMKYGSKKASSKEIDVQKKALKRLYSEQEDLHDREAKLNEDSIARYNDLDSFLELAKNGYKWWKKANDDQKKKMADILILNVIVDGNSVASVSLNEPFAEWARRPKKGHGGRCKT